MDLGKSINNEIRKALDDSRCVNIGTYEWINELVDRPLRYFVFDEIWKSVIISLNMIALLTTLRRIFMYGNRKTS